MRKPDFSKFSEWLVLCLAACSVYPFSVFAQKEHKDASAVRAPLMGGVTHLEQIEPLQPEFRPGAIYDANRNSDNTPHEFWYQIPAWSAGTWYGETSKAIIQDASSFRGRHPKFKVFGKLIDTPISAPHEETRVTRNNETWGFQKDRSGGIWQFAKSNYTSRTDSQDSYTVSFVRSKSVLKSTSEEIQLKYIGTQIHIDAKTNRIISSLQVESIQTYTAVGANERKDVADIKSFDENGKPITIELNTSIQARVKPFEVRNKLGEKDMYKSFVSFLRQHNLNDVIPDMTPTSKEQNPTD